MVSFIRVTSLWRLMLLHQNNIHMGILTSVLTSRLSGVLMMQSAEMCLTVIFLYICPINGLIGFTGFIFGIFFFLRHEYSQRSIILSFQRIIFTDTAVFFVNKNTILGVNFINCKIVCCSGNHTTVKLF